MTRTLRALTGGVLKANWFWLTGVAVCVLAAPPVLSQQPRDTGLLAEYVSPSALNTSPGEATVRSKAAAVEDTEETLRQVSFSREMGAAERWEKFEAEFGLQADRSAGFRGRMESAKYGLDRSVHAVNELVRNVEDAVNFEYRPWETPSSPEESAPSGRSDRLRDALENLRIKSDIDLDLYRGGAFVGMRLEVPFGD